MKRWYPRAMIVIDVLLYLGFGIAFLVAPAELLADMDIVLGSPASTAEIRAMYGGVELGIAAYLCGTFRGWVTARQALALVALLLGGLGGVRLLSVLTMSEIHTLSAVFALVELSGALLNVSAWWVARDA